MLVRLARLGDSGFRYRKWGRNWRKKWTQGPARGGRWLNTIILCPALCLTFSYNARPNLSSCPLLSFTVLFFLLLISVAQVRYDIHSKLVNFMAPVSTPDQMQDTARNELFSSLFGVRKIATTAAWDIFFTTEIFTWNSFRKWISSCSSLLDRIIRKNLMAPWIVSPWLSLALLTGVHEWSTLAPPARAVTPTHVFLGLAPSLLLGATTVVSSSGTSLLVELRRLSLLMFILSAGDRHQTQLPHNVALIIILHQSLFLTPRRLFQMNKLFLLSLVQSRFYFTGISSTNSSKQSKFELYPKNLNLQKLMSLFTYSPYLLPSASPGQEMDPN